MPRFVRNMVHMIGFDVEVDWAVIQAHGTSKTIPETAVDPYQQSRRPIKRWRGLFSIPLPRPSLLGHLPSLPGLPVSQYVSKAPFPFLCDDH